MQREFEALSNSNYIIKAESLANLAIEYFKQWCLKYGISDGMLLHVLWGL